jgi:CHASE2 domain-containing sensor protein
MKNQESSNKPNHKQDIKDSSIISSKIQQAQTGEGSTVSQHITIIQVFSGFVNSKLRKLNLIDLFVMIAASVAISSIVMGIRYLGVLQGLELKAFDLLMQLRPAQNLDPRILVVTIDDEDLEYQLEFRLNTNAGKITLR